MTKAKGGSDAEPNRITLCTGCYDKLHEQRYGANKHSKRIKTAFAARRARGASIGRPRALMPISARRHCSGWSSGELRAAVARSYGVSKATVYRMVRSACPSGGLLEAGLVMQVTYARNASQSLTLENATKAIPAFSGILADLRLRES